MLPTFVYSHMWQAHPTGYLNIPSLGITPFNRLWNKPAQVCSDLTWESLQGIAKKEKQSAKKLFNLGSLKRQQGKSNFYIDDQAFTWLCDQLQDKKFKAICDNAALEVEQESSPKLGRFEIIVSDAEDELDLYLDELEKEKENRRLPLNCYENFGVIRDTFKNKLRIFFWAEVSKQSALRIKPSNRFTHSLGSLDRSRRNITPTVKQKEEKLIELAKEEKKRLAEEKEKKRLEKERLAKEEEKRIEEARLAKEKDKRIEKSRLAKKVRQRKKQERKEQEQVRANALESRDAHRLKGSEEHRLKERKEHRNMRLREKQKRRAKTSKLRKQKIRDRYCSKEALDNRTYEVKDLMSLFHDEVQDLAASLLRKTGVSCQVDDAIQLLDSETTFDTIVSESGDVCKDVGQRLKKAYLRASDDYTGLGRMSLLRGALGSDFSNVYKDKALKTLSQLKLALITQKKSYRLSRATQLYENLCGEIQEVYHEYERSLFILAGKYTGLISEYTTPHIRTTQNQLETKYRARFEKLCSDNEKKYAKKLEEIKTYLREEVLRKHIGQYKKINDRFFAKIEKEYALKSVPLEQKTMSHFFERLVAYSNNKNKKDSNLVLHTFSHQIFSNHTGKMAQEMEADLKKHYDMHAMMSDIDSNENHDLLYAFDLVKEVKDEVLLDEELSRWEVLES